MAQSIQSPIHSDSLADVLERVLDKGVVIAGDVVISLVGIELLSIKLRLLITTVDKATEMGINWWEMDPALCSAARDAERALEAAGAPPALAAATAPRMPTIEAATLGAAAGGKAIIDAAPVDAPAFADPQAAKAVQTAVHEAVEAAADERRRLERDNQELRGRLAILEKRIAALGA